MIKSILIVAGLIILMNAEVVAQTKPVTIHGAGASSCGSYVKSYDQFRSVNGQVGTLLDWPAFAHYRQYEEWINGYVFGMETRIYKAQPLKAWDRNGMQIWMYNYCQKHPIDVVANAALAFFKALGGNLIVTRDQVD